MKKSKKLIAILCFLAMTVNMSPVWAFADNSTTIPQENKEIVTMNDIGTNAEENFIETVITTERPANLDEMTNIALNKTATSNLSIHTDRPITAATNGVRNSFAQPSSYTQLPGGVSGDWYVTVDLGSISTVETVMYGKADLTAEGYPDAYKNNVKSYQIQVSVDNETWINLGDVQTEEEISPNDIYFVPSETVTARYVRLYAPNAQEWATVDEISVFAHVSEPEEPEETPVGFQNLAPGCEALSDQPMHQHHSSPALAIDGDLQTYAQASSGQPYNTTLIFPNGKERFNTVVLKSWYNEYYQQDQRVRKFGLSVSEDGEEWERITEYTLTAEDLKKDVVLTLDEVIETEYLKFEMLEADAWVAINELEIYDTTTLPPVISDVDSNTTLTKGDLISLRGYEGAEIYYTTDGSDPKTSDTAKLYTDPIAIEDEFTLKAYAKKDGLNDSEISEFHYLMRYIDASPESGKVQAGDTVTLTSHMENAEIYYTTDGSNPKLSDTAKLYTEPIVINEYTELNTYCKVKDGARESVVYTFSYATGNSAKDATITAKSSLEGFGPENVVDENPETVWKPGSSAQDEWICFDFGDYYDFASLTINWLHENAGYQYIVETSSDGNAWYNYYVQRNGTEASDTHIIPNLETHRRYMRIRILGSTSGKEIAIREVEILGKKSAEAAYVPMYDQDEVTDIYDRPVVNPIPDEVPGVEDPVISLDGQWSFATMPQNGFWRDSTDLSDWYQAQIPGELDAQGIPVYYPENPNWYGNYGNAPFYPGNNLEMAYKRQIYVPEDFEGQKVFLRIDKAFSYARVWVNGQYVRDHRGEYNAWDADITDYVVPGENNWITVSITAEGGKDGNDWGFIGLRSFRGILGSMSMYATPENHLNRLHYKTDLDEEYKDATLKVMGNAFLEDGKTGEVELSMKDPDGNEVALEKDTLVIDENFTDCTLEIPVKNPEKWDAEHPNLYEVTAKFKADGEVVETITQKIGFREVEVKVGDDGYKKFMVNGVSTKLRGVNYHTVYGNDGPSYSIETERELLEKVKEMNVNYIRISHYPMSTAGLEICDELGIYVEQENSITFAGMFGFKTTINEDPRFKDYIVGTAAEMVEKDMSHPCIVMWSLGNESFWGANHKAAARYVKAVDPTIPTIFSYSKLMSTPDYPVDEHAETDLFSNHYLDGANEYNYYDKPIVWDEYAHNYMGNEGVVMTDPGMRENYYNIIRYNWEKMYNHPQRFGGAIWDFTDNTTEGETHVMGNGNWGMLDVWGNEKPEFWAAKTVYAPAQYKGEELVAMPKTNASLKLPYENRYETVAFDDDDFEIVYYVNGEKQGNIESDLAPKESGNLLVPAPKGGWELGDKVRVEFYKTTAGTRRIVVADEVILGQPNYYVADAQGNAPVISEDDTSITVTGTDFQIDFSKETGKITNGTYKEETVLIGGPHLSNNQGNQGTWTQNSITAEQQDNVAVVTIDGAYGDLSCTFTLKIDAEGKIETTYALNNSAFNTLEIGVAYDLPATTETLSWIRDGYTTQYTDDQACAPEGTAYKETEWKRQFAVDPGEHGWKDYDKDFYAYGRGDQGGRGTNDFRSSKTDFYYAEMGYAGSDAVLSVYGDGNGSVRAVMNADKTVRLNINNDWGYVVTNELSNTPSGYATVPENYSNTVVMKLSDTTNNYEVEYTPVKEQEFIKVSGVTAGSSWGAPVSPDNLINNSGMSSDIELDATHDNHSGASTMWHTTGASGEEAWVQFDLGIPYQLNEMWIWNINQQNNTERGLKNVKIEYSVDGKEWTELAVPEGMTFEDGDSEYPFQFAQASGEADQKATNLNDGSNTPVSFNGAEARYVKITASPETGNGSWGQQYYGLSEVRFTVAEEEEPEEPVSKNILEKFLNEAKEHVANGDVANCVESVQKLFEEAIAEGDAVMADPDATREEVMNATLKLVKAIGALDMLMPDKTDLEMAIELGDMIVPDLDKYVEAGKQEFQDALAAAKEVFANGDALQEEVDEAYNKLIDAITALRLKANKDNLADLIGMLENIDLSKYTEETAAVFRSALALATDVMADDTLSEDDQAVVDNAVTELKSAYEGLKLKEISTGDNTGDNNNNNNAGNNNGTNGNTGNTGNGSTNVPETGDSNTLMSFLVIVLLSGFTVVVLAKKSRKSDH